MRFLLRGFLYISGFHKKEVIDHLANILSTTSIIAGVAVYIYEGPNRRRETIYRAWQVINSGTERGGRGGIPEAIRDLQALGQSLAGVNLSHTNLTGIDLRNADLRDAKLVGTDLTQAQLSGADLTGTDLSDAKLSRAVISKARLDRATLTGGDFEGANFAHSRMEHVYADHAKFWRANFLSAHLDGATFSHSDFFGACFTKASMLGAQFLQDNFTNVDLSHVRAYLVTLRLIEAHGLTALDGVFLDPVIDNVRFDAADLRGAHFANSHPSIVDFSFSVVTPSSLDPPLAVILNRRGKDFERSQPSQENLDQEERCRSREEISENYGR